MKSLVSTILIICVLFNSSFARANDYMPDAEKSLEWMKQNTENYVNLRLSQDVSTLFENLSNLNQGLIWQTSKLDELEDRVATIQDEFTQFEFNSNDSEEYLQELQKKYVQLNRELFDLSWTPSTAAIVYKEFIPAANQLVKGLKYQCEVGRNDVEFNPRAPVAMAPPKVAFTIFYSSSGTGSQYNQPNYTSKDMQKTQEYTGYASAVAAAYGGVPGAVVGAALVTTVAIISYFSGAKKRFKMMKEYHEAELYKFYHSLTSQDVSAMYRERCKDITESLDDAITRIDALSKGGQAAENERQRYYKEQDHFKQLEITAAQIAELRDQITKKQESKASEQELKPLIEKEKLLSEQFDKKDIINMASFRVVEAYGINAEKSFKNFNVNKIKTVLEKRQKALYNLQRLYELKRYANLPMLESETAQFKEYLSLRSELQFILKDTFEYIFNKRSKNSVYLRVMNFKSKVDSISLRYLNINEFKSLQLSADWLAKFYERQI